ncbi:nuclear transport factor 2 family protein [Myxococcota bacterium]|nr:nuclear transport factor 2 family protein [Myxococcota bacterium]
MDAEERKRLTREFFDLVATRDVDAILARMTPEPAWAFFAQRREGVEGVRSILRAASELYQPGSMERDWTGMYVDGDVVIAQTTMRAQTFKGEDYENHYVLFVHFEGERVALVEEYMDTAYGNEKFSGWQES